MRRTTAFSSQSWRVSARVRMVSTLDGEEIFSCTDRRYSSAVLPAIDPIDMAINSVLSLIHLRDISLARTEYEVGREIVLRLPTAQRNISEFQAAAKKGTRGFASSSSRATSRSRVRANRFCFPGIRLTTRSRPASLSLRRCGYGQTGKRRKK